MPLEHKMQFVHDEVHMTLSELLLHNPLSKSDQRRILFLRPFWDVDATAVQLKIIAFTVKDIGTLVALRNGDERSVMRLITDHNPWSRFGPVAAKIYNILNPPFDVQLVASTDDDWQKDAIRHITDCDAVILHIAPRIPSDDVDSAIETGVWAERDFSYRRNPVYETGVGQGLLRELQYCYQAAALDKTFVLIPETFQIPLAKAFATVGAVPIGTEFYMIHDDSCVPMHKRMSAADYALTHLAHVRSLIPYRRFTSATAMLELRLQLLAYLTASANTVKQSIPPIPVGIPSGPIALPPDGELKWIRFTKIETLTKIPPMQVVELSRDEVRKCNPAAAQYLSTCKSCGGGQEGMFFFQRGLIPDLELGAGVLVDCQYCGFRDFYG